MHSLRKRRDWLCVVEERTIQKPAWEIENRFRIHVFGDHWGSVAPETPETIPKIAPSPSFMP
jgi:hypothetical protein